MTYTENKKKNNQKWDKENLKRMSLAMPIKLYEQFEQYCIDNGMSKNGMINRIIAEKIKYSDQVASTDDDRLPWEEWGNQVRKLYVVFKTTCDRYWYYVIWLSILYYVV